MVTTQWIQIRQARSHDSYAIRRVNRMAWRAAYHHIYTGDEIDGLFQSRLRQHGSWVIKRDQKIGTFVAENDGRVVGFIGISSLLNDDAGEVTTLYVHPEYQGMGVGRQLWEHALYQLSEAGCSSAWVWVLEKAPACHFYERRGCIEKARGIYSVGNHDEVAIGYWVSLH